MPPPSLKRKQKLRSKSFAQMAAADTTVAGGGVTAAPPPRPRRRSDLHRRILGFFQEGLYRPGEKSVPFSSFA
ncbi:UNVERIFIED_CONTAM: hypothetical protein Sradi_0650200 [Sesamum radiatum]|uniref:Uncharacterized protein n=1 Tax=Sesamum radiatum TaxID=300843 RepID=A0AAW2VL77_SESRA